MARTPDRGSSTFTVSQGKDQFASLIIILYILPMSISHTLNFSLATSAPVEYICRFEQNLGGDRGELS